MLHRWLLLPVFIFQMTCLLAQSSSAAATVLSAGETSTVTIPVNLTFSSIEDLINRQINGLIYEDNSYTDNDNDQFKIKVWKKESIKLSKITPTQLRISVPLKVWAEKGVGALGYMSYQSTTFEATLRFKTSFALRPDWTIKSVTEPDGFEWHTKPVLKYTYVDIPITPLVSGPLEDEQKKFCKIIDDQITKNLNLKPYAINIWNALSPAMLVSEEYHVWLKLSPKNVKSMPLSIGTNSITTTLGVEMAPKTFVGCKPDEDSRKTEIPALQLTKSLFNDFNLITAVSVPYPQATEIANKQFKGQIFEFQNGKKKIKVEEIEVSHDQDIILLNTDVSGSLEGRILISGLPYVDLINQRIALKNVEFHLSTKNLFHKSASWLFGGTMEKIIERDYGIPILEIKSMAQEGLASSLNQEIYPGIKMSGQVGKMDPTTIKLTEEGILIYVETTGQMKIDINQLTF